MGSLPLDAGGESTDSFIPSGQKNMASFVRQKTITNASDLDKVRESEGLALRSVYPVEIV